MGNLRRHGVQNMLERLGYHPFLSVIWHHHPEASSFRKAVNPPCEFETLMTMFVCLGEEKWGQASHERPIGLL